MNMLNNVTGDTVILNLKTCILNTAFLKIQHKFLERQYCIQLNYHQLMKTEWFLGQDC